MLTILIITYICGVFVTGFILTILSMFSDLSRLEWRVCTAVCMILWPVIWIVMMVVVTLIIIGFMLCSGYKGIGKIIKMRSK
jgi:hypothetical protein